MTKKPTRIQSRAQGRAQKPDPKPDQKRGQSRPRTAIITVDRFYRHAAKLREEFENRFADPKRANPNRFVWDYWNVPGQYTTLRTPAYHFFPNKMYEIFHQHLAWWGRRNLGCHDISPTWLSCYVEGCRQELHADLPHGPWAFVFSLTPWQTRSFTGGHTILLQEDILNYWQDFAPLRTRGQGAERGDVFIDVPALFNRLLVFDPRIPHGVSEVRGPRDVLDGRLVMHGWFVQPRPFIEGPLAVKTLQAVIDDLGEMLANLFAEGLEISGMVSWHFKIAQDGSVQNPRALSNSLRHPSGNRSIEIALAREIQRFLRAVNFGKQKGLSFVTLPLVFEN